MTITDIKQEILKTYQTWKSTDDSLDSMKYSEMDEAYIRELLADYYEARGYLIDGFPNEKRELGKTNYDYDEDYFTWERYEKYTDMLCLEKEDVLEFHLFYFNTFGPMKSLPRQKSWKTSNLI